MDGPAGEAHAAAVVVVYTTKDTSFSINNFIKNLELPFHRSKHASRIK
jgi:hypothetical protein